MFPCARTPVAWGCASTSSHLAPFDYIAVSGSLDGRMCEWADHLHEHFADPVSVRGGRYVLPSAAGYGITMRPESLERFRFPDGPVWRAVIARSVVRLASRCRQRCREHGGDGRLRVSRTRAAASASDEALVAHHRLRGTRPSPGCSFSCTARNSVMSCSTVASSGDALTG